MTDEDEAVVADHVDEEYDEDEGADGNGGEDEDHRHHQHYHYPRLGHHHHHHHHHHCNGDDGTGRSKSHHETKELDHVLAVSVAAMIASVWLGMTSCDVDRRRDVTKGVVINLNLLVISYCGFEWRNFM